MNVRLSHVETFVDIGRACKIHLYSIPALDFNIKDASAAIFNGVTHVVCVIASHPVMFAAFKNPKTDWYQLTTNTDTMRYPNSHEILYKLTVTFALLRHN